MRTTGRGDGGGGSARALGVLSGPATYRDVAEGSSVSPVAAAGLAEVAGLGEVVVVVVAELGIGGVAAWARKLLLFWWWGSRAVGGLGWSAVLAGVSRHLGCERLRKNSCFESDFESSGRERLRRSGRVGWFWVLVGWVVGGFKEEEEIQRENNCGCCCKQGHNLRLI